MPNKFSWILDERISLNWYNLVLFAFMSSSHGTCEIVEAKDELSSVLGQKMFQQGRIHDRVQRPPTLRKAQNKTFEDDINKLFEAINLRTSKSLDLSDPGRNASKKPIRNSGSQSPVIGFSEPVSLKQALRGLCISQAAEMAAIRRPSMASASPQISEVGKMTNLNRSVVMNAGESSCSPDAEKNRKEFSTLKKESIKHSSKDFAWTCQGSLTKPTSQSLFSSSSFSVVPNTKSLECTSSETGPQMAGLSGYGVARSPNSPLDGKNPASCDNKPARHLQELKIIKTVKEESCSSAKDIAPVSEVDKQLQEIKCSQDEKDNPLAHSDGTVSKQDKKISNSISLPGCRSHSSVTPSKAVNSAANKAKQKPKLQTAASSSVVKSSKDMKSTRSTSRSIKPGLRNRNIVIRKSKKASASININSKESYSLTATADCSSGQLICQSCQCSFSIAGEDPTKDPVEATDAGPFKPTPNCGKSKYDAVSTNWENSLTHVVKTNLTSKSAEKGDISQSSKSSNCDFSSSTTSLSEDSSLIGSTYGNRSHMSKDVRWVAIDGIRKHYGFLGLSHFNLLKKLGSGDIGTVYLAELFGTCSLFAIKVMDNEFLSRRQKLSRAQTEREILRMLDHPFVPTLYAQFTSDNLSCLVMEFCPGGDLHVLRQKQLDRYFSEHEARFYVAEVLLALEYLHMLGIVYRDLKPENILVREDGHIMLTDFDLSLRCSVNPVLLKSSSCLVEPPRISGQCRGPSCIDPFCTGPSCKISCLTPRFFPANARARKLKADAAAKAQSLPQLVAEPTEARSNSFVGTHEYLAPEIIKGEGHGSAVDWWTFGVLLYELLYGRTPFKGSGNEETLANVVLQSLKFPDTPIVSLQARDLIRRLLVKEPENRLGTERGSAEIKRHPFFEGLNWALIRCTVPPQVHEMYTVGNEQGDSQLQGKKFMDYTAKGEHLEFELF